MDKKRRKKNMAVAVRKCTDTTLEEKLDYIASKLSTGKIHNGSIVIDKTNQGEVEWYKANSKSKEK